MPERNPIYETRKDVVLATDKIRPYGDWNQLYSETKKKEVAERFYQIAMGKAQTKD